MMTISSFKKRVSAFLLRINGRSLRERVLMFCALQIVVFAVLFFGFLLPQWRLQQDLLHKTETVSAQLSTMSAETRSLKTREAIDPDVANRELLRQSRLQSDQSRADLIKLHDVLVKPEEMVLRLEEIIKVNGRLQLISLKTLPVENLMQGKQLADKKPADNAVPLNTSANKSDFQTSGGIYRHGVAVVVQGSYQDIVDYLVALESGPSGFYWGDMKMQVDMYPVVTMQLTLFTLSMDKKWLSL